MHIESLYYVLGLIAVIFAIARSQQRYARHTKEKARRHGDYSPLVDLTIFGLFMWGAVAFFSWLG